VDEEMIFPNTWLFIMEKPPTNRPVARWIDRLLERPVTGRFSVGDILFQWFFLFLRLIATFLEILATRVVRKNRP
jgi:hypothetical protein